MFWDIRAGVATTMSGKSASKERWTASDVLSVRLTAVTDWAQNVEKALTTLVTC